jgi:hypothetical protein
MESALVPHFKPEKLTWRAAKAYMALRLFKKKLEAAIPVIAATQVL